SQSGEFVRAAGRDSAAAGCPDAAERRLISHQIAAFVGDNGSARINVAWPSRPCLGKNMGETPMPRRFNPRTRAWQALDISNKCFKLVFMSNAETENAVTRQRLLEAAGQEFAEHGFRAATVRDICKRAE